jgi:hypothetical protein
MIAKEDKTAIVQKIELADTYFRKVRGLMLRRRFDDTALIFTFKKPIIVRIHMLFVFFPIDLVFLDQSMRIVDTATLKPFIGYRSSNIPVSFVLELPEGTIKRFNLKKGDKILLTDEYQ